MKELIEAKINDVLISDEECYLKFITDKGDFLYSAEGDCCSESWFSEIIGLNYLVGGTVNSVEELELPDSNRHDGNCRQEEDSFYGFGINSNKGTTTIVFRNSSNGYYGGWCSFVTQPYPDDSRTRFKSIAHLSDWCAYEPSEDSYFTALKYKNFL